METIITRIYRVEISDTVERPVVLFKMEAGFPSPAEDYLDGTLDLNQRFIKHPSATYFAEVAGDSMVNAGILPGSTLIIDRSVEPADKKIVIAAIDGKYTVKRLRLINGRAFLMAEADGNTYPPIELGDGFELHLLGVATGVVTEL